MTEQVQEQTYEEFLDNKFQTMASCYERTDDPEQRLTALHEAGHALGFRLGKARVRWATIIADGSGPLGCVVSYDFLNAQQGVVMSLLGEAAELEVGGVGSFYSPLRLWRRSADYESAKEEAQEIVWENKVRLKNREMRARYETLDDSNIDAWEKEQKDFLESLKFYAKDWKPEFNRLRREARRLARQYRTWIEGVADLLLEKGTLTDKDIPQLTQ